MEATQRVQQLLERGEFEHCDFKKIYAFSSATSAVFARDVACLYNGDGTSPPLPPLGTLQQPAPDALGAAYMIVGVNDARRLVGCDLTLDDAAISTLLGNSLRPKPRINVIYLTVGKHRVMLLEIIIDRRSGPVRLTGRSEVSVLCARRGSRNLPPAEAADIWDTVSKLLSFSPAYVSYIPHAFPLFPSSITLLHAIKRCAHGS